MGFLTSQGDDDDEAGVFSRFSRCFKKTHARVALMVGLDSSGKSTLLNWASQANRRAAREIGAPAFATMPTPGLQVAELRHHNTRWRIWDMSGQGVRPRDRPLLSLSLSPSLAVSH